MLDIPTIVKRHATSVPLEMKNIAGEELSIHACVYVFSATTLHEMVVDLGVELEKEFFAKLNRICDDQ